MCRTSAARIECSKEKCDIPPRLAIFTNSSFMPNLRTLSYPHGLEEALVVHRPGPGHLGEVVVLIICYVMFKSPYMPNLGSVLEEFDTRIAGPWMRRRWPIR